MKRVLYVIASLFQIAAVIGAYFLDHFTRAKLGMNRWVMSCVRSWEDSYPMETFVWMAILAFVITLVIVLAIMIRRGRKTRFCILSFAVLCVFDAAFAFFAIANSSQSMHAYYFVLAALAIACVIQFAKTLAIICFSQCQ